ncbi:MAG TPA: ABC transporter permease [Polyangiaceae bacterium]|jgi:sulfonate transport system permease protein|nr:ABC transporter permease [Polyangiaceae bacterium]
MSALEQAPGVRIRRGLVAPLALLILWELVARFQLANVHIVVPPWRVVQTALVHVADGSIFVDLAASLQRDLEGLVLGALVGVIAGALLGASRLVDRLVGPTFHAAKQVAVFAWIPLMSVWFGTGELAKVVFIALSAFYPVALNTEEGVRSIAREHLEVAKAFRLSRWSTVRTVLLPAAAPSIFAGLRLGLVYSWLGTIGAEYLLAPGRGIGNVMIAGRQRVAMDEVFLGIIVVGLVGFTLDTLAGRLEARALRWRPRST